MAHDDLAARPAPLPSGGGVAVSRPLAAGALLGLLAAAALAALLDGEARLHGARLFGVMAPGAALLGALLLFSGARLRRHRWATILLGPACAVGNVFVSAIVDWAAGDPLRLGVRHFADAVGVGAMATIVLWPFVLGAGALAGALALVIVSLPPSAGSR